MSYSEIRLLPVRYRKWFIKRLIKHYEKKNQNNSINVEQTSNMTALNKFEDSLQIKK